MTQTISENQIARVLAAYPGTPNVVQNLEHKRQWAIWRIVLDRITTNPNYRYGTPHTLQLLKMANFACQMMGHFNTLTYGGVQ